MIRTEHESEPHMEPVSDSEDELLTPAQAAKVMNDTEGGLLAKRSRGLGPVFIRLHGTKGVRYRRREISRWLLEQEEKERLRRAAPVEQLPIRELTRLEVGILAWIARFIAANDPSGVRTRMSDFLNPLDESKGAKVVISSREVGPFYPVFSAQTWREATIAAGALVQELDAVERVWEVLPTMRAGDVPLGAVRLAFRSLNRACATALEPRKPGWLTSASGSDVQLILRAALGPVVAALKPEVIEAMTLTTPHGVAPSTK
jgi:hypothetical protein